MRNAVLVPLHLDAFVGQNLTFSHQISVQLKISEHFRAHFFVFRAQFLTNVGIFGLILSSHAPNDGKICAPCVIRGARAAKGAPSWQDLRAVYSQTAVCRAFRMHGAHILPKPARFRMRGARILPRTGDFPVRGRFRDAWSAKLATDCRPGTHRGGILPRIDARERTAREYCRCQSGQGRIRAQSRRRRTLGGRTARAFCHRRAPGNAPWRNLATTSHLGTHFAHTLPSPGAWERIASISCHRQTSENAQRRHTATASRPSRSALHVGEWVQSLGCAVGFGAQHFLCEGVGIPPSRGLTAGNDFESALFRWATMSPLRVLQSCAVLCAEAKSALTFI